ncbi:MAG: PLP-dependent transferase, partial [Nitrososphaerota archaeon]|nr:PLP-dependent transferase [Nitrososphaerota archaeon]
GLTRRSLTGAAMAGALASPWIGGARAAAFASGMAALTTLFALFDAGDEILFGEHLYGGTYRLAGEVLVRQGIGVRFVPTDDAEAVETWQLHETDGVTTVTTTMARRGKVQREEGGIRSICRS